VEAMKARVNLTPDMMEKLLTRNSLYFKVKPGCDMIEVRLLEEEDSFSQFDRVFSTVWKSTLDKIEKIFK
jgi:hypothetical protein